MNEREKHTEKGNAALMLFVWEMDARTVMQRVSNSAFGEGRDMIECFGLSGSGRLLDEKLSCS